MIKYAYTCDLYNANVLFTHYDRRHVPEHAHTEKSVKLFYSQHLHIEIIYQKMHILTFDANIVLFPYSYLIKMGKAILDAHMLENLLCKKMNICKKNSIDQSSLYL